MHYEFTFKIIHRMGVPQLPREGVLQGIILLKKLLLKHSVLTIFIRRTRPVFPDLGDEFEITSIILCQDTS